MWEDRCVESICAEIEELQREKRQLMDELEYTHPHSTNAIIDPGGILGLDYLRPGYGQPARDRLKRQISQIDMRIQQLIFKLNEAGYEYYLDEPGSE